MSRFLQVFAASKRCFRELATAEVRPFRFLAAMGALGAAVAFLGVGVHFQIRGDWDGVGQCCLGGIVTAIAYWWIATSGRGALKKQATPSRRSFISITKLTIACSVFYFAIPIAGALGATAVALLFGVDPFPSEFARQ